MRRVDRVKIMIRKEIEKEPKQKVDEDKNKKKDIKKEESISSWSVESVEVIKENGIYKKDDKDLQDKIEKSMLNQKGKKKKGGKDDNEEEKNISYTIIFFTRCFLKIIIIFFRQFNSIFFFHFSLIF